MSSYNLGPLTVPFSPPTACTSLVGNSIIATQAASFYAGVACNNNNVDQAACWPPVTVTTTTGGLYQHGYYSPGLVCPVGYVSACTQIGLGSASSSVPVNDSNVIFTSFIATPTAGQTAIGCCPSGYSCTNYFHFGHFDYQTCVQEIRAPSVISVASCASGATYANGVNRVTAGTVVSRVFAPLVQLLHESSNFPPITSSPTNTAGTLSDNGSSSGLSNGAKIGIGVGVPVVLILVALGAFILYRRQKASVYHDPLQSYQFGSSKTSLEGKQELSAEWGLINEMPDNNPATVHELPVHTGLQ